MCVVYKHTNLINQKNYIGITRYDDNPNKRWRNGTGYVENKIFFADIVKYGWDNFSHEILEENLTLEEAIEKEKYYIQLYNSTTEGYNISAGGCIPSDEGIERIRVALTGIKRAPQSIEKQLQTKQERYGNQKGINYPGHDSISKKVKCNETQDVFASISEAERWCNSTKVGECCQGYRQHAGRHPVTQELLSWSYADKDSQVTIECNEPIQKKKKILKVLCVETEQIYKNATEASKETGIAVCNILRVCNGKRKTAGKKHWIYIEEE